MPAAKHLSSMAMGKAYGILGPAFLTTSFQSTCKGYKYKYGQDMGN